MTQGNEGETQMISKIVRGAVLSGVLFAVTAPMVAYAADAPKTKAACKKAKDMKWDKTTKACVKK
jgi:ABC-type Fe2+-enterobactin transport system substrate-binding protein